MQTDCAPCVVLAGFMLATALAPVKLGMPGLRGRLRGAGGSQVVCVGRFCLTRAITIRHRLHPPPIVEGDDDFAGH